MLFFHTSLFVALFIIIPSVLSSVVDIYCPLSSRFKSNCAIFFTISNLNLTNISINIVSNEADIESKMVIDLDCSLVRSDDKGFIVFKPTFSYDYVCDSLVYYPFSLTKAVVNRIISYLLLFIVIEMLYKEGRGEYIILGETKADKFIDSVVNYLNLLDLSSLKVIKTDTPSSSDIISQIPSISNPEKVSMFLFYSKTDEITSFLSKSEIINLKNNNNNNGIKIITFGVIDEYTTIPNKAVYENTFTVNGYFQSLHQQQDNSVDPTTTTTTNDIILTGMDNDVYFISYLMLRYLDSSYSVDNNNDDIILNSESFISLKLSEFNIVYNDINYTMSESNVIERTMYYGKVDSDGKIGEIIDLYSNTIDNNPYTFVTDTNFTICRDSQLVVDVDSNNNDNSIVRIGFLSSLSFENEYVFDVYRGMLYSFNNYQQINSNPNKRILTIIPPIGSTMEEKIEYLKENNVSVVVYFMNTDMYDEIKELLEDKSIFIITFGYNAGQNCIINTAHIGITVPTEFTYLESLHRSKRLYHIYSNTKYGFDSNNYIKIASGNANLELVGSCAVDKTNLTNCLSQLPSNNDYMIITTLGSEINRIFLNSYSKSNEAIMLDIIIDDYKDMNGIENKNIYGITQLTPYLIREEDEEKKLLYLLYNKYEMNFYEYYSYIMGELLSKSFSLSVDVNLETFYTMIDHLSEDQIDFSKQHLISDSLYFIKLLDNGKYEEEGIRYYNVYQQQFDYFYFSNHTYLYCDFDDNSNNNYLGYNQMKYIIIINPPFLGLKNFLDVVVERLSSIHHLSYRFRIISLNIDISDESSFINNITELVNKYHPIFLGGKTAKERRMINSVITTEVKEEQQNTNNNNEEEEMFLFHIFPFSTEECFTNVFHVNNHIYLKIYDSIFYFINKGGKNFYIIEDEIDEEEKEFMKKQFNRLNEIFKYLKISFNTIYINITNNESIEDYIKDIKPNNNDVFYIYINEMNITDVLDEFQSKGINSSTSDIILLNYFNSNFYNSTDYYYSKSFFSMVKDFHYFDEYCLKFIEENEDNSTNTDIYISSYLSILIYSQSLLNRKFHSQKKISKILHDLKIPLSDTYESKFSLHNRFYLPTILFKPSPSYHEVLSVSTIHNIPRINDNNNNNGVVDNTRICDCSTEMKCYDTEITNIGFLFDSDYYPIEAELLIRSSILILDNNWLNRSMLNSIHFRPFYFDMKDKKKVTDVVYYFKSNNVNHIFGCINQTIADELLLNAEDNKLLLWYTGNSYVLKECNKYLFRFVQSVIPLLPVIFHEINVQNRQFMIVTDDNVQSKSDYYDMMEKYTQTVQLEVLFISITKDEKPDEIFNRILAILPKGGVLLLNTMQFDLTFLKLLDEYMKKSDYKYYYDYLFLYPEYYFNGKERIIDELENIWTFSYYNNSIGSEYGKLIKSYYGDDYFITPTEVFDANAIYTFLYLTNYLKNEVNRDIEKYQQSILNYSFPLLGGSIKMDYDYSFTYIISQMKYKNRNYKFYTHQFVDPSMLFVYSAVCDYRNTELITSKIPITLYLIARSDVEYSDYATSLYPLFHELNHYDDNVLKFSFLLTLISYDSVEQLRNVILHNPFNTIYIGVLASEEKEVVEDSLERSNSILFNLGFADPNTCSERIISMNNYLNSYILPIILRISSQCARLTILYNRNSKESVLASEFFRDEIEHLNIMIDYYINIGNIESITQFITANQRLIVEPNCIANFLNDKFTIELIEKSEIILSYPITLFSFNVKNFIFPYYDMIHHYIVTNYNPFDENSIIINEIKRILTIPVKVINPSIVYAYMTANYLFDIYSRLDSNNNNDGNEDDFFNNNYINNAYNITILHPSNINVSINEVNYLVQPLYILNHNSNNEFDYKSVFYINENLNVYQYLTVSGKICKFSEFYNNVGPIVFGYIYSYDDINLKSRSYQLLVNGIVSLIHLTEKYIFNKDIGVKYYLYNVKNQENLCNEAFEYMKNNRVEYLFTFDENLCMDILLEKLSENKEMIYFYTDYYYEEICNKQVYFSELVPSQYFNSIINYISINNEYLWYYYVIYDSKHNKSNNFNNLFHDILEDHIPYIYSESVDIGDKTEAEIETLLKRYYYLFGVVVIIVDNTKLDIVLKSLTEEYIAYDPSTLFPIVIPIDPFTISKLYSSIYNNYVYFATSYKLEYLDSLIPILERYSLNITENLLIIPPLYTAHEIIFEVINNIQFKGFHNKELFYKYIHSNVIHTFSKDIQIKSNNILKSTIDLNYYDEEDNIELGYSFKLYNYPVSSSELECGYSSLNGKKKMNLRVYCVIDMLESSYKVLRFTELLLNCLNRNLTESVYYTPTFKLISLSNQCSNAIDGYIHSDEYDIMIFASISMTLCGEYFNKTFSTEKPIFLLTNEINVHCTPNLYVNGLFPEVYTAPVIDYLYMYRRNTTIIMFISPKYKVYYNFMFEYINHRYMDIEYISISDDYKVFEEYVLNKTEKEPNTIFTVIYEQDGYIAQQTVYLGLRINSQSLFISCIHNAINIGGEVNEVRINSIYTQKNNHYNDDNNNNDKDHDTKRIIDFFYTLVDDVYVKNDSDISGIEYPIPLMFSTILFIKRAIEIANNTDYEYYKPFLYNTTIETIEGVVGLRENNHFKKRILIDSQLLPEMEIPIFYDGVYFDNNTLSKCNLKDNGVGIFDLLPLYIGFFFQANSSETMPIISTILYRLYSLQLTSDYLQGFVIAPIFGSYDIDVDFSKQFDKYFEENDIGLSVVFTAIPHNASKNGMEEIADRYKTLIFNLDYSVNIGSYYLINGGLSMNIFCSYLYKYTLTNSDFIYVVGNDGRYKLFSKLFEILDDSKIGYERLDLEIVLKNLTLLSDELKKCPEYSQNRNCSFITLMSYEEGYEMHKHLKQSGPFDDITFYIIYGKKMFNYEDFHIMDGFYYISTYFDTLDKTNYTFLSSQLKEFNDYVYFRFYDQSVIIQHVEIAYSLAGMWMELVNKSLSILSDDVLNSLYYHEYQSPSGVLYISDKNFIERRLYIGMIRDDIKQIEVRGYTEMIYPPLYELSYYTNPVYIGIILDYDSTCKELSKRLQLVLNELMFDDNSDGKQFISKSFILDHTENDKKVVKKLADDKSINFIFGCTSVYCKDLLLSHINGRKDKLFFCLSEIAEKQLCYKNVITSSFPISHAVDVTLHYLDIIKMLRVLVLYEDESQNDFINEIKKGINNTTPYFRKYFYNTSNSSSNNNTLTMEDYYNNFYEDLAYLNCSTIIINLLKGMNLKDFLTIYIDKTVSLTKYSHLLYYYDFYHIGRELTDKLTNFILLSAYSGDTRDMSVFLFEQYIQNRLGSEVVVTETIAKCDCLYKLFVSSFIEANNVMLNDGIEFTSENIVAYTQIMSQTTQLTCALGHVEGSETNTISHQIYLSEISQTSNLIKIYPDLSRVIEAYSYEGVDEKCYNGPTIKMYEYSDSVLIITWFIFGTYTFIFITLIILLIINKQKHIVRRSSLIILVYAVISSFFILLSATVKNFNDTSDAMCVFYDTFLIGSIINAMLTIVLKSWRIHMIYNNSKMKKVRISSVTIILLSLFLTFVWIMYAVISALIYKTGYRKVSFSSEYSTKIEYIYVSTCEMNLIYNLLELVVLYTIAGFGVYFSWTTRKTDDAYNESKALATSIFFLCVFILAYFCVYMMIAYKPGERLIFDVLTLGFSGMLCSCLMIIPKIYKIYYDTSKSLNCFKCLTITKIFPNSVNTSTSSQTGSGSSDDKKKEIELEKIEENVLSNNEEDVIHCNDEDSSNNNNNIIN